MEKTVIYTNYDVTTATLKHHQNRRNTNNDIDSDNNNDDEHDEYDENPNEQDDVVVFNNHNNDENDGVELDRKWLKQEAAILSAILLKQKQHPAHEGETQIHPNDDKYPVQGQPMTRPDHGVENIENTTTTTTTKREPMPTTVLHTQQSPTNTTTTTNNNNNNNNNTTTTTTDTDTNNTQQSPPPPPPPPLLDQSKAKVIKLIKSTRLKGYMTLTLAALINLDAARTSTNIDINAITIVPSTDQQRIYAQVTAIISLIGTTICCCIHFDRITPLQHKCWISLFQNGSIYEGGMIVFYTIWWTIATGFATSVNGIAGDGKGQYSLYYSTWACCLTSYWILDRWCVAKGWSSFNSFIASWPNRSPAWICIMMLSFFTLIWYVDLWQNHVKLNRPSEQFIIEHFDGVGAGQWKWLIAVSVCTFCPAVFFVAVELFRETKADGSIAIKSNLEALIEGIWFVGLTFAWIVTVMIATTPRGAASLIGNSYFFTWVMSIFVFEGFIWYIHDRRKATYQALKEKQDEYCQRQEQVLQQTKEIHRKYEERIDSAATPMNQDSETLMREGQQQSRRGFSHEYLDTPHNQQNNTSRGRF